MTKTSGEPVTAYENFDNTASEGTNGRMGEWAKRRRGEGARRRNGERATGIVQSTNGIRLRKAYGATGSMRLVGLM